jgi:hypothetical protein
MLWLAKKPTNKSFPKKGRKESPSLAPDTKKKYLENLCLTCKHHTRSNQMFMV